jgi:hypothetical protein
MCYKDVINLFGLKIEGTLVYLISTFALIYTTFNKNLEVVASDIKTGTCDSPYTSKKFEYQISSPLLQKNYLRKFLDEFYILNRQDIAFERI